jgi:hypothetical protein
LREAAAAVEGRRRKLGGKISARIEAALGLAAQLAYVVKKIRIVQIYKI